LPTIHRHRVPLALLGAGALALTAPAAAGAAFGAPVELDTGVGVSAVAVDGAGGRLVLARGSSKGALNSRILGVDADGRPGGRRTLAGVVPEPIPYRDDQLLWTRTRSLGIVTRKVPNGRGGTRTARLARVRLGLSAGSGPEVRLGAARYHATAVLDQPARLTGTPSGNLVMAWSDVGDDGVVRVYASWRRSSSKAKLQLGTPRLVSGSRSSRLLGLATGRSGESVLVFEQGASEKTRRLYTRSLDIRKGELGTRQTLRRGGPGFSSVAVAVGRNGRAVIAWGEQDAASDRTKPYVVRATSRDTDGSRFSAPKPLDRGGTVVRAPGGELVAAIDRANRPIVGWNQVVGSAADGTAHDLPRVAQGDATGRVGAATDLAAAGRIHGVATTAQGATGLVLVREQEIPRGGSNGDRGTAVQVAVRPAGGTLGAPATLDAFTDEQLLDRSNAYGGAAIGALPDGTFTVAWTKASVVSGKLRSATSFADGTP
jgi:hypothetical protein